MIKSMTLAQRKYLGAAILLLSLAVASFLILQTVFAVNPFDIQYPVAELGNCKNQDACKEYCDDSANAKACLSFAKKHGFIEEEEADRAEKLINLKNGPGGCNSQSSCEKYCNDISHIDECLAFGEENGFLSGKDLDEAKAVNAALKKGVKLPGDCQNKTACDNYCKNLKHASECIAFAKENGLMDEEEAEEAEKVLPFIERGETPGGCVTREDCDAFCNEEENFEACLDFAEKAGLIPPEELEIVRKTGGKGPGNCHGRLECDTFCSNPDNQEICFEFGKEHGLIPEEDLQMMEEGREQMKSMLEEAEPELKDCLANVIGEKGLEKIESGGFFGGPEIGDQMRTCFEQFMGGPGEGEEFGPPEGAGPQGEFSGPGGCSSPEECKQFCKENPEECKGFGPQGSDGERGGSSSGMPRQGGEFRNGPPPGFQNGFPSLGNGEFGPPAEFEGEFEEGMEQFRQEMRQGGTKTFEHQEKFIDREEMMNRIQENPVEKLREFRQETDQHFFDQGKESFPTPPQFNVPPNSEFAPSNGNFPPPAEIIPQMQFTPSDNLQPPTSVQPPMQSEPMPLPIPPPAQ